jgi:hypothetical protein
MNTRPGSASLCCGDQEQRMSLSSVPLGLGAGEGLILKGRGGARQSASPPPPPQVGSEAAIPKI